MHIGDLETDGLVFDCTRIWINITFSTMEDLYYFSFDDKVIEQYGMDQLEGIVNGVCDKYVLLPSIKHHFNLLKTERVCYHNFGQFDRLVVRKLIDKDWEPGQFEDSYILSQLYWPDRGLHGIAAWGDRFGVPKPVHEDWTKFSAEMVNRCFQDVVIGVKTWYALEKERKAWEDKGESWEESTKIEYGIAKLQGEQELHGVKLDVDKAYSLADEIYTEIQAIDEKLLSSMPMRVVQGSEVSTPFKLNGEIKQVVARWFYG